MTNEIINYTDTVMINDYIDYMRKYEDWDHETEETFLEHYMAGDTLGTLPEAFVQSYYAELSYLDEE